MVEANTWPTRSPCGPSRPTAILTLGSRSGRGGEPCYSIEHQALGISRGTAFATWRLTVVADLTRSLGHPIECWLFLKQLLFSIIQDLVAL
jgi:hypothetical protein